MTDQNQTAASEGGPRLPALRAGGTVQPIVAQSFDDAWRIANVIVKSGMAPRDMETPEKCMIAIMHGAEAGMTPMMALQSIAVINGRPSIWGDGALGLVQGSGLMEWHKEWHDGADDDYAWHFRAKRKGDQEVKEGDFSVADAKKAGLWGKTGPWKQYTDRMLQMRARSFGLRNGFADVLRGLQIREEVQDMPPMVDATPAGGHVDAPPPPPGHKVETPKVEPEIIPPPPRKTAPPVTETAHDDPPAPPPRRQAKAPPPPEAEGEIPGFLKRDGNGEVAEAAPPAAPAGKPEPAPAAKPAAAAPPAEFDEQQWLTEVSMSLAEAEGQSDFDLKALGEWQSKAVNPHKSKVGKEISKETWREVGRLMAMCIGRLNEKA